jgi:hypothetical protein
MNEQKQEQLSDRFRFILDVTPQWWRDIKNGIWIDVGATAALISGNLTTTGQQDTALPGDWIIREPNGKLRCETYEQGRIEAREFLINERKKVGL